MQTWYNAIKCFLVNFMKRGCQWEEYEIVTWNCHLYSCKRVTCIITIEKVMYIMHCKNTTCIIITASHLHNYSKKKTNFMVPFYGWGSTASRLQPLRGGSLLFTIQFPATHIFAAETVNCICAAGSNCIIATE